MVEATSTAARAAPSDDGELPAPGTPPRRQRPGGAYCPGGDYGSPYPYMRDGKIWGCDLPSKMAGRSMEQVARALCWTGTTFVAAAVVAGATITFSFEVKWWWQIQEFLNLGEEDARSFELTRIGYGQSDYYMNMQALDLNGTGIAQQGIDVRNWNAAVFQRFFPVPACGLDDRVELDFQNITLGALDFAIGAMGPAVLQIG